MILKTYISFEDESEINVKVEYSYYAGCPGKMYMANGDPGYPEEPASIDILSIKEAETNREILDEELSDSTRERLEDECMEHAADYALSVEEDRAIDRYEGRLERERMGY